MNTFGGLVPEMSVDCLGHRRGCEHLNAHFIFVRKKAVLEKIQLPLVQADADIEKWMIAMRQRNHFAGDIMDLKLLDPFVIGRPFTGVITDTHLDTRRTYRELNPVHHEAFYT